MFVKEINDVKKQLENLKADGYIKNWSIPYENLLTRLSAAIFYFSPTRDDEEVLSKIWEVLGRYEHFSFRQNHDKKLSDLMYSVTFNEEEKIKNQKVQQ